MRVFLGLRLSPEMCESLRTVLEHFEYPTDQLRPSEPRDWHLTLAFLGEIQLENVQSIISVTERALKAPPIGGFFFTSIGTFPSRHPHCIAAHASCTVHNGWMPFVNHLRDLLSLVSPGTDRKAWHPHVTLIRSRKGTTLLPWTKEIKKSIRWMPSQLTIFETQMDADGPHYSDLHVFSLHI